MRGLLSGLFSLLGIYLSGASSEDEQDMLAGIISGMASY